MRVTVQLSAEAANALILKSTVSTDAQLLLKMLELYGVILEPVHPGTADVELKRYSVFATPKSSYGHSPFNGYDTS